jgi:3-dehydroquinate dehydratase
MAPEFRRGIYALDEKEIGLSEYEAYERAEAERIAALAALEASSKEAKEKIQAAAAEQKKIDDLQDSFDALVNTMVRCANQCTLSHMAAASMKMIKFMGTDSLTK